MIVDINSRMSLLFLAHFYCFFDQLILAKMNHYLCINVKLANFSSLLNTENHAATIIRFKI